MVIIVLQIRKPLLGEMSAREVNSHPGRSQRHPQGHLAHIPCPFPLQELVSDTPEKGGFTSPLTPTQITKIEEDVNLQST